MKTNYDIIEGRLVSTKDANSKIQVFVDPDELERLYLLGELQLDEHTLASALDPDELSRVEFEPDHVAVIFKRPKHYAEKGDLLFRVSSMGLYLFKDRLIAVLSNDDTIFESGKDVSHITGGLPELLIRLFARSISQFLSHIHTISVLVNELEDKLKTTMTNRHLLHLFMLNRSMTYYLSAISANSTLIDRLRGHSEKIGFTAEHNELLEDLSVDNAQCYKQAEIYSVILSGLMDARAAVVNNNLNLQIRLLTILTVIFLPLNVIASVFGMSEYTVFTAEHGLHWKIAYPVFGVGLIVVGFLTYWFLQLIGLNRDT